MQYCPHCMRPIAGGGSCPNCGGDVSWTGQAGIDLPVGTVLSGGNGLRTYQIGAARGKGGFGITYIALETNSGRRMAVKEYFPTRCAFRGGSGVDVQAMTGQEEPFQSGMKSFLDEGKMLLSQDDLTCVVHVIDYFQANGTAYLVMEYLDGVALHTQMTRMGGRIPVGELMTRLALLIRDIGQLHRRGVIHRDISPDNIMWMPEGGLKLLDFGSARSMESGKSMTVLMKQGFSPIEQYRSKGQGPYTDIYALAATIYYCVTGVIPPSSMERMGGDALQSPIALGAALTAQQEAALLWALSIQPDARPQSMEEFAAMLYKEEPGPRPVNPVQPVNPVRPTEPIRPMVPDQNQSGDGKKRLPVFIGIGAAAAVVVAVLIGVIVWMGGDKGGTVEHSERPGQSAEPTPTAAPTPTIEPTQNIVTGTVDGFLYEIIDQSRAVLTGCELDAKFDYMPDRVEGLPITEIADGAFAGAVTGGFVNLPYHLETIGANAFRGCADLSYVAAYSDVVTESSSFSGCDNMWYVSVRDYKDVSGWRLPSGVGLYYYGMETGVGKLDYVKESGSLLIGDTVNGYTVLLSVRSGTETVTGLDDVGWICPWALDNLDYGASIELGENTLYPYEVFSMPFYWSAPDGALSDRWLLSCKTAADINAARPSGAPRMEPDLDLMYAAKTRAEEYAQVHDINTRPDGRKWSTVLNDNDISYHWTMAAGGYNIDNYAGAWNRAAEYMTERYTSAVSESDSSTYAGQYPSRIGVAVMEQSDARYAWWGYVIIP